MRTLLVLAAALAGALILAAGSVALLVILTADVNPAPVAPVPMPVPRVPDPCPDGKCPPKLPRPRWETHGVLRVDAAGRSAGTGASLLETADAAGWTTAWRLRPANTARASDFTASVGGPKHADGTEIACDLPGARHKRNTSSKGLGLCVFWSIHMACDWADVQALYEMPVWMTQRGIAGGGYPSKVAELIPRLCKERGVAVPDYFQIEDAPDKVIPILQAASRSGRMCCVTYSKSPTGRYGGSNISHMVNLPHIDQKWAVVLDNNYPGADAYEWMNLEEFARATSFGGQIWAIIFLDPPPPMPPCNALAGTLVEEQATCCPAAASTASETECPARRNCDCGCRDGETCRCAAAQDLSACSLCAKSCACGCNHGKLCECSSRYHWGQWENNPARMSLWKKLRSGKWTEVGYLNTQTGDYYPATVSGTYLAEAEEPPFPRPAGVRRANNYGLEAHRLGHGPAYSRCQQSVTRGEVLRALEKIPDDRGKLRLTLIGAKADRAQAEADLAAHPGLVAALKDAYVVKGYEPTHWHVKDYGFVTSGKPTIYVQKATGEVLFRADDYQGPEDLASTLRKLRPDYKPDRDPGWAILLGLGRWNLGGVGVEWLAGGVCLLVFLALFGLAVVVGFFLLLGRRR